MANYNDNIEIYHAIKKDHEFIKYYTYTPYKMFPPLQYQVSLLHKYFDSYFYR